MPSFCVPVTIIRSTAAALALCTVGGARLPARAQAPQPPPSAPSVVKLSPQPTVTREMGDPGGKFFGRAPDPAKTRRYYIAAEPVLWDFVPDGDDPVCGKLLPKAVLLNHASWKIRYVQYADSQFSARVLPSERLGIAGPVLRGITGEYLAVTFLNRSGRPLSMHPHGVRYDKDSEGAFYNPAPGRGAAVAPGARFTYVWHLDAASGPRSDEPSSKAWLYHSHVAGDEEINLGLFGCIIVTDPARARPDGTPKDVDREMTAVFKIFEESLGGGPDSDEAPPIASTTAPIPRDWATQQEMAEEGQRDTINGLAYGNLHGLEMNEGERVRWYMFGLGSEHDFHTAHWHGMTVVENGRRQTDVVELLPASMKVADLVADNPGRWLFHCHVAEHMDEGMYASFIVHGAAESPETRASSKPEIAFLGMPQSLETIHFESAELALDKGAPSGAAIHLGGQVTVPDPFPIYRKGLFVQIGDKTIVLRPDRSGVFTSPGADLLIKNASSAGVVNKGVMSFELTLKGSGWLDELERLHITREHVLVGNASLPIAMQVGNGRHSTSVTLKPVAP